MVQVLEYKAERCLTDFEILGLAHDLNLADGHAYQDLPHAFDHIVADLPALWRAAETTPVPEAEERFRHSFSTLAHSPAMETLPFKICPTASNSIEIVAKVLADRRAHTRLIEPTFDNLALLLKRQRVALSAIDENQFVSAAREGSIVRYLEANLGDALFLVHPNNPTGRTIDIETFQTIADFCSQRGIILVIDNTFRFYNRNAFDDYAILKDTGVSFMAFEDTGKVWPTQDLKASLLFCSSDLERLVTSIFNEVYLCHTRFGLTILERFVQRTSEIGLGPTIWFQADEHRAMLRRILADTDIEVDETSIDSNISVEWLNCRKTGLCDFELINMLAASRLTVLPGRQFFWQSADRASRQFNFRVSLMKPSLSFHRALNAFWSTLRSV
jgi:aspartate/methionine/tyrosine aminotransferase